MLRHFPNGRTARTRAAVALALTASMLAALVAASPGVASDDRNQLTQQKATLTQRLAASHADVDELSKHLLDAQNQLDRQTGALAAARQTLAAQQLQVAAAAQQDADLQAKLVVARAQLAAAQRQLTAGRRSVAHQRSALVGYAVSAAPAQIAQLSTLNLLFSGDSTQQLMGQVQASNDAAAVQLTDLQRLQAQLVLLSYTEQRVQRDEHTVATARRAAAANLVEQQQLAAKAQASADGVAAQVAALQHQRDVLATAKQAAVARIHQMSVERTQLEAKLKRIAEQEAAARHARLQQAPSPPTDGGYLSYPVHDTYITSPYGMRMNPVIHVWELHDGTDFHADCGSPVYAAAPGTILSEYWNDAYGNRLFINHGLVRGVSLMTSYNHLTSYVAHVGERVARGQLVAYSGTTGWSTGCHLHFSVYVNGTTVNPVTWL